MSFRLSPPRPRAVAGEPRRVTRHATRRSRGMAVLAATVALGLLATTGGPVAAEPAATATAETTAAAQYRVLGPRTLADRSAVAATGAAIDYSEHGVLHISATGAEARAIEALGFKLEAIPALPRSAESTRHDRAHGHAETNGDVGLLDFPSADSAYRPTQ